jgi:hypothetical protein
MHSDSGTVVTSVYHDDRLLVANVYLLRWSMESGFDIVVST